jgi:hypothetical protein
MSVKIERLLRQLREQYRVEFDDGASDFAFVGWVALALGIGMGEIEAGLRSLEVVCGRDDSWIEGVDT